MSDGEGAVKDRMPIIICMPWSLRHVAVRDNIVKDRCSLCQGEVFYNAITGLPKGVKQVMPVCGACAVDMIDADTAKGETHQFALTEAQEAGRGALNAQVREIVKTIGMDALSKQALDYIRANRAKYDASPSASQGGVN
jgi:hypothetical protein